MATLHLKKPTLYQKILILCILLLLGMAGVVLSGTLLPNAHQLKLPGEIQAHEVKVSSRLGGRVKSLPVHEGDIVKDGQLLAQLDGTDLSARIAEAKASLAQAEAQLHLLSRGADVSLLRKTQAGVQEAEQQLQIAVHGARPEEQSALKLKVNAAESQANEAKKSLGNAKKLLENGIISQQKYDSLQDAADASQSNLESMKLQLRLMQSGGRSEERKIAQAQLSAARAQYTQVAKGASSEEIHIAMANVDKARSELQALQAQQSEVNLLSPFAGTVSLLAVTQGELLPPGRPVLAILDYDHLWVDVYLPESQLSRLKPGQSVDVHAEAIKNSHFKGTIALINPKSEFMPNSGDNTDTEERTFRVKVNVAATDKQTNSRLYPGMKVTIGIP